MKQIIIVLTLIPFISNAMDHSITKRELLNEIRSCETNHRTYFFSTPEPFKNDFSSNEFAKNIGIYRNIVRSISHLNMLIAEYTFTLQQTPKLWQEAMKMKRNLVKVQRFLLAHIRHQQDPANFDLPALKQLRARRRLLFTQDGPVEIEFPPFNY